MHIAKFLQAPITKAKVFVCETVLDNKFDSDSDSDLKRLICLSRSLLMIRHSVYLPVA